MTTKLLKALSAVSGVLIILAVMAAPWVTSRVARRGNPYSDFPLLPFQNELVRNLSDTVILFELFCGAIALIALGIHLTELGMKWYNHRAAGSDART